MSTPAQQKVLFLQEKQGSFAVSTREVPKPGAGQLLVRNEAAGLNPLDWKIQAFGLFVEEYPAVLGLDAAGIVEAVGEGVITFKKGDRVLYEGFLVDNLATFQQYTVISAALTAKLPEKISFEQGATLPVAVATAAIGLYNTPGGPQFIAPWAEGGKGKYAGQPIVIIGGSSVVGSLAIQLAKLSGFSPIITTASLKNAPLLQSFGAMHVLDRNLRAEQLRAEVTKIAGGPVAVVYDAISLPDTQTAAYGLLAPDGKLLIVLPDTVKETSDGRSLLQVQGVTQFPNNHEFAKRLFEVLPSLLESGDIKPLNVEVVPGGLGGITTGLEKLKNNQVSAAKLVVLPWETA